MSHPVVRVKICGLTSVDDALACARAGVDWIGLNFHPASPRFLDLPRAAAIVEVLPPSVLPVGVFVDRPAAEVAAVAHSWDFRSYNSMARNRRKICLRSVTFRSSGHFD